MAEILGVGLTHYPPLIIPDEEGRIPLRITLARDERVPPQMKIPTNWPEAVFTAKATVHPPTTE